LKYEKYEKDIETWLQSNVLKCFDFGHDSSGLGLGLSS